MKSKLRRTLALVVTLIMMMGILPVEYASAESVFAWLGNNEFSAYDVYYDGELDLWRASTEDGIVMLDSNGTPVISGQFWLISKVNDNLFYVSDYESPMIIDRQGNKVMDLEGHLEHMTGEYFIRYTDEGYSQLENINGDVLIPPRDLIFHHEAENRISITNPSEWLEGLMDYNGNELLPCAYYDITYVSDNCVIVTGGDEYKSGIVDIYGNTILPMEYDGLEYIEKTGTIRASKDGRIGIIGTSGQIIAPIQYYMAEYCSDDCIIVMGENYKYGIIDIRGNIKLSFDYEQLQYIGNDSFMALNSDYKYGIINSWGGVKVPYEYLSMTVISPDVVCVYNEDYEDSIISCDGTLLVGYNEDYYVSAVYDGKGTYAVTCGENLWRFATLGSFNAAPADQFVLGMGLTRASVWGQIMENDVCPLARNQRTMLPARFVAENLGAEVSWDGEKQQVTVRGNGVEIVLFIGSTTGYVNGVAKEIDSPVFAENGRTYTPVRFIAENLGATVNWDGATQSVIITR